MCRPGARDVGVFKASWNSELSCPQIPKQGAVGTTTKPSARREKASCRRMGRDLQVPTVDVAVTNLLASCCGFEGVTVEGYIAT